MRELRAAETARLLRAAFRLFAEPEPERPTLARIGDAAGLSCPVVIHWYGDSETLFRLAVRARIAALAAPLAGPRPTLPLREAIRVYAGVCARLFRSDDYRRLVYLVMRDGPTWPWLAGAHERGIVDAVRGGLGRLVREAGAPSGARLEIRASGTRAFARRLHEELALPMLLPGRKPPTHQQVRTVVERASEEALAAVYSARALTLALGEMAPDDRTPWSESAWLSAVCASEAPDRI
jgi:AcrR family transcriptional regulator